jgi:hypothetical protein
MAYDNEKVNGDYTIVNGMNLGLSYFRKEDRFKSEKDFVKSFLLSMNDTIKKIYNLDIENIELEKTFNLIDYDLPSQRVDIYCTTKQGIDLFIECKNPNNINAELNNSIGQMLNYQVIIESIKRETILIFATSIFNFYMLKVIKRFNLNYDIILHNKVNNAFILRSEL